MTSEKALRLYGERGLLHPRREHGGSPRLYDDEQTERARRVVLLRRLDIPIEGVRRVLEADDPTHVFDELWSSRRSAAAELDAVAEYVRSRLAGRRALQLRTPQCRELSDRIVASSSGVATLAELSAVIPLLTQRVFAHLVEQDIPVTDAVFVQYHERATEQFPARVDVCVPIAHAVTPAAGVNVALDPAHVEAYIPVTRAEMRDQSLLVLLHDQLSSGATGIEPCGSNREVYYRDPEIPAESDIVADIAVPTAATARTDRMQEASGTPTADVF